MYVTPVALRAGRVRRPRVPIGEGIVVPAGNPMGITSYQDIADDPTIRVGTGAGWLEYDYMVAVGVAEGQIVTFPDAPSGMAGLQADRIDVFTGTSLTMRNIADRTDGVEFVEDFEQPVIDGETVISYGAAAFRPATPTSATPSTRCCTSCKASGELADIIGAFGFGATELPMGDMTSAELCGDSYR
jgi:polar amino acid transport system substrate-binding protein